MPSAAATKVTAVPNDLEAYWLPFTPNRAFKASPRLIARAKDMYYYTPDGRAVLDGTAGLWCTNAGHNRDSIVAAIRTQLGGPRESVSIAERSGLLGTLVGRLQDFGACVDDIGLEGCVAFVCWLPTPGWCDRRTVDEVE